MREVAGVYEVTSNEVLNSNWNFLFNLVIRSCIFSLTIYWLAVG